MTVYVTQEEGLMRLLPDCKALRWYPTFINVIAKDAGKPVGISAVASHYGFSQDEIAAKTVPRFPEILARSRYLTNCGVGNRAGSKEKMEG